LMTFGSSGSLSRCYFYSSAK